MEKIRWKVNGMDCANCALIIHRYLEKQGGKNVKVNFATGNVSFDINGTATEEKVEKGVTDLGYKVIHHGDPDEHSHSNSHINHLHKTQFKFLTTHFQRFWVCLPFTLVLMLHMVPGIHSHWLTNAWAQLALTTPVYLIGMSFFGISAWKSLRNGIPNMNVLVAIGATSAFVYSLYGTLTMQAENYMFYETTATIITLVFLGNYLEEITVASTQRSLNALAKSQIVMANMIAYDDKHEEHIFSIENTGLKVGDLILIKSGDQVPIDCKILWGNAQVNEAIITGESVPAYKQAKDKLIGGSILQDGTVKAQVIATGSDTVLSGIIFLVKQAQGEKPPVQQLADKISSIFIPIVLGIAVVALGINWIVLKEFTPALMRAIAVLVIACPCAMGLATPAAIAVGLGRGARKGILFRNATSLELFKNIKQVVFDKTGTLTTGKFVISNWQLTTPGITDEEFMLIVYSLEKYSNHPIAKSIAAEYLIVRQTGKLKDEIRWKKIEETRGVGMQAEDSEGNIFHAVSYKGAKHLTADENHNVYVIKNNQLLGWIDVQDEVRPEAKSVVNYLHAKNIKTVLLSGDRYTKAKQLADELNIGEIIAEQSPEQKLQIITAKSAAEPTAMVGDGINDAPALAKATVGISMSDASQIAMQTAQVVLMNKGLKNLPLALGLGRHTYITIKENLFWAFAYNIIAIPIAAFGLLTPTFSALVMAFSDVVLAINSGRLFVKKVV